MILRISFLFSTDMPQMVISPSFFGSSVARVFINVVFPAPFLPSSPNIPCPMVRLTSLKACFLP